jgi:flagellar basal-body rod modification protein FlgD
MTMIPPVTDTSAIGSTTGTASTSDSSGLNQLDNSQTFLQLLVAQLENQDPTNPTDPTSFMTEIAQLTAVQSQTSLSAEEQTVAADSMIGLTVTGSGASGASLTGQVTGVLLSSSGAPTLEVQSGTGEAQDLALTDVTSVTQSSQSTS